MKWKDGIILGLTLLAFVTVYDSHIKSDAAEAKRKSIDLSDQIQNLEKRLEAVEEMLKYSQNEKISRVDYLENEITTLKGQVDLLKARVAFLIGQTRILENRLDRVRR
jgi:hypothetical protein